MSSQRKSFILYKDSLSVLDDLNDEQVAGLFRAIKEYQLTGEVQLTGLLKIAFSPFKAQFSRDDEKYIKTCEARANAGSKGGKQKVANASKSKQKVAKLADSVIESVSDSGNDSDSDKEVIKDKKGRFTPPSDIETVSYFESKGSNNIEAEKFWLFYDSKNWMVGKSKMQKWKSSASGWIARNKAEAAKVDPLAASSESNWHEEDLGL